MNVLVSNQNDDSHDGDNDECNGRFDQVSSATTSDDKCYESLISKVNHPHLRSSWDYCDEDVYSGLLDIVQLHNSLKFIYLPIK